MTRYPPLFTNIGCHPHWTMIKHPEISNNHVVEDLLHQFQKLHAAFAYGSSHTQEGCISHRLDSSSEDTKFLLGNQCSEDFRQRCENHVESDKIELMIQVKQNMKMN